MLRFKFNVADALQRKGINIYQAKKAGLFSQVTYEKIRDEDMSFTVKTLDKICQALDMDVKDVIEYVPDGKQKNVK